jgi:transposase
LTEDETRARILLKADEGWKDKEIAQALNSSVATIERISQRFVEGNLEKALHDDPRPGTKWKLDGRAEAQLICSYQTTLSLSLIFRMTEC